MGDPELDPSHGAEGGWLSTDIRWMSRTATAVRDLFSRAHVPGVHSAVRALMCLCDKWLPLSRGQSLLPAALSAAVSQPTPSTCTASHVLPLVHAVPTLPTVLTPARNCSRLAAVYPDPLLCCVHLLHGATLWTCPPVQHEWVLDDRLGLLGCLTLVATVSRVDHKDDEA
jgi:hypothetical protein